MTTKKSFRTRPNKTEQIARFLLGKGSMTARQIYDAGFRFKDGEETSPYLISVLMNKMHMSSRYAVERSYVTVGCNRLISVKVLAVIDKRNPVCDQAEIGGTAMNLWRQLLTRKPGQALSKAAA